MGNICLKEMEPARMERAGNPDADKGRLDKIALRKDKVEDAADVGQGRGPRQGEADKIRAKVAAEKKVLLPHPCCF